jgi:hypothetical protein
MKKLSLSLIEDSLKGPERLVENPPSCAAFVPDRVVNELEPELG